jgi:sporulation protein YlmC with PRC-barrel domain
VIRASDLTGCVVRTESGQKLGRVHDLRLQVGRDETYRLAGVVIGRGGMLQRLGVTSAPRPDPVVGGKVVPWHAITRLEEGSITVRDEAVLE